MKTSLRAVSILLLSLTGCAYITPFVQNINLVSVQEETALGNQISQQVSQQMKVVTGTTMNAHVEAIGRKLVASLPRREFEYHFGVIEDNTPNAFTIPGGYIYVHTGLFKLVSGDDELAGVIAHEIGHAYLRHPAKGLTRAYGVDFLSSLLFKENSNRLKAMSLQLMKQSVLSKYGREDEREADRTAFYLLPRAGYAPNGLLNFLYKIQRLQQPELFPFLSTHPPTPERTAYLEAMLKNPPASAQLFAAPPAARPL